MKKVLYEYKVFWLSHTHSREDIRKGFNGKIGVSCNSNFNFLYSYNKLSIKEISKKLRKNSLSSKDYPIVLRIDCNLEPTIITTLSKQILYKWYFNHYYFKLKNFIKDYLPPFKRGILRRKEAKALQSIKNIPDKFWLHIKH